MDEAYKVHAEARLVGKEGCQLWELLGPLSMVLTAPTIYSLVARRNRPAAQAGRFWWLGFDALLFPVAAMLGVQLPVAPLLCAATLSLGMLAQHRREERSRRGGGRGGEQQDPNRFPAALVPFRAMLMLLTCYCILAVDFVVFPDGHMKTEHWGYSLMDLGVGVMVFSHGITMGASILDFRVWRDGYTTGGGTRHNTHRGVADAPPSPSHSTIDAVARKWLKTTFPLLALGLGRAVLVEAFNYQRHVSEYGVHWNFFFTLALLPVVYYPFRRVPPVASLLLVLGAHQAWLLRGGGTAYVLSDAPRVGYLEMNKEGVASLPGYTALFVAGCLQREVLARGSENNAFRWNKLYTAAAWAVHFLAHTFLQPTSRRLCNLSYVSLVVAVVSTALLHNVHLPPSMLTASPYLSAVSRASLPVFFFANLMTGATNILLHTLSASPTVAYAILSAYIVAAPFVSLSLLPPKQGEAALAKDTTQ
eukprot:Rhum_TRINITY_DN21449_c0_g1::Rhum_TRINITY_DN21449_c0_g1_i1::g.174072::m.174072/K05283/PIGW; phosphatidylinositol glycan, class W